MLWIFISTRPIRRLVHFGLPDLVGCQVKSLKCKISIWRAGHLIKDLPGRWLGSHSAFVWRSWQVGRCSKVQSKSGESVFPDSCVGTALRWPFCGPCPTDTLTGSRFASLLLLLWSPSPKRCCLAGVTTWHHVRENNWRFTNMSCHFKNRKYDINKGEQENKINTKHNLIWTFYEETVSGSLPALLWFSTVLKYVFGPSSVVFFSCVCVLRISGKILTWGGGLELNSLTRAHVIRLSKYLYTGSLSSSRIWNDLQFK